MRLLATALLTSGLMLAQHHHDAEGPDKQVVADEYLQRPIALLSGVGTLPLKGTANLAEAQQYSDQGYALLASYVWLDAIRSFRRAAELDPDFALAHVGLARAYWGAGKQREARESLARARAAAGKRKLPEQEEGHIRAFELQVAAMQDTTKAQQEQHAALKKHLDVMVARDPADAWAWVLRGQAEEPGPWGRGQRGQIGAIAFYETALIRDPKRWDANHYLIHSYENVGNFAKAEEHGRVYRANADAVPHAHHMHGHILPRVNQWAEARTAFEKADALHREVFQREKLDHKADWHFAHNLHLMSAVYVRQGQMDKAEQGFREECSLERGDADLGYSCGHYLDFLLMAGRYDQILKEAQSFQQEPSPMAKLLAAVYSAEVYRNRGDKAAWQQAMQQFKRHEKEAGKIKGDGYRRTYIREASQEFREWLVDLAAVQAGGKDAPAAERRLIALADKQANRRNIDAWAEALLRLAYLRQTLAAMNKPELARQVEERIKKIDADWTPAVRVATR